MGEVGSVELRCASGHLLARVKAPTIVEGNLIEVECRKCRKAAGAVQVLHYFNVLGVQVDTVVVRRP